MSNLDAFLREGGLTVVEIGRDNEWQTRVRPGDGSLGEGAMVHHTAGTKSLSIVTNGRSDLSGPLCDFHVPKDGTINLVSGGRANHAGAGAQKLLDRIRKGLDPAGDAGPLGYVDGPIGNGLFYGIEAENLGDGKDPWPDAQLNTIALLCALLCRRRGWGPERVVAHKEWTRRKPDPRGVDMTNLRARVRWLLATWGSAPTPTQPVKVPAPPAAIRHEEDMLTTHPVVVALDDQGRGNTVTGLRFGKLIGKPVLQVPIRPNHDHYYPGDPNRMDPHVYEAEENGNLLLIVRGGSKTTNPSKPETLTAHVTVAD